MYKFMYAGIGSRTISPEEKETIHKIANKLNKLGGCVYSGNAEGSDQAFQIGSNGNNIVFLPWNGFEKDKFDYTKHSKAHFVIDPDDKKAFDSVFEFHPNCKALSPPMMLLMGRNFYQVAGYAEWPTIDFIVCCVERTSGGIFQGGTSQALRIAKSMRIPIVNIRDQGWQVQLSDLVKSIVSPVKE